MKSAICGVAMLAVISMMAHSEEPDAATQNAQRIKKLEAEHAHEAEVLSKLQEDLQRLSGRTDISADGLQKTAARLDDQLEALTFEEVASRARMDALTESIADLSKKAEMQAAQDEIVMELRRVFELRSKAAAMIKEQAKAGAISTTEVDRANIEVAEARIKLLERQRSVGMAAGSEVIAGLNRELVSLSIAARERHARRQAIQERLEHIRIALSRLGELQFQEEKVKAARARVIAATPHWRTE